MPRDLTDDMTAVATVPGHLILDLAGPRARALAERLLAPEGLDEAWAGEAWAGIDATLGAATRVGHDWDPVTNRLMLAAPA